MLQKTCFAPTIALALCLIACSLHPPNMATDASSSTAGDMANSPDLETVTTDGGTVTTYATTATLMITGSGSGTVSLGSTTYTCPQFQPCEWPSVAIAGNTFSASADVNNEFLGWLGPCDPQVTVKNSKQCKVLAGTGSTPPVIKAVFGPVCSAQGWCATRLPIPAGRTIISVSAQKDFTDLLVSDGFLYRISQKPGGMSSSLQPFDLLTTRTQAIATCSTPDGTLYFSTNNGIIASYKSKPEDPTNLNTASRQDLWIVGMINEQISSLVCGNNGDVWATSLSGILYTLIPGTPVGWKGTPIVSRLPIPTDSTLSNGYVIGDKDALFVGSAGLVVRSKNDVLSQITAPSDVTTNLYAVSGSGEKAWIAGANGTVLFWDGMNIKRVTLPPPPMGVSGDLLLTVTSFMNGSDMQAYASGLNGKIYRCSGASCTAEASGVRSPTLGTSFTTSSMHIVCGSEATCLTKQR